jgi:hypothetical protein
VRARSSSASLNSAKSFVRETPSALQAPTARVGLLEMLDLDRHGSPRHRSRDDARTLPEREQRQTRCGRPMRPEEQVERAVEPDDILVPVHEQAAERHAHVRPAANAYALERADRVHQPSVVDFQPGGA